MSRFQTVYAISSQGYFNTSRPSNHPTIIRANQRNVHLGYVKCNQIFKGQSQWKDPLHEDIYKLSRSMPAKSQMARSQITNAETNALDQSTRKNHLLTPNIKQVRRTKRLVSRSVHFGSSVYRIDKNSDTESNQQKNQKPIYDFEQTMKVKIPLNISEFESFKSENLYRQVSTPHFKTQNKNYVSLNLHLNSEKIPQHKLITSLTDAARLQNSYHSQTSQRSNLESSRTYTIKSCINNEEENEQKIRMGKSQNKLLGQNETNYNNTVGIKLNGIIVDKYKQPQPRVEQYKINEVRTTKQMTKNQDNVNQIKIEASNGYKNESSSITRLTLNKQNEIQCNNKIGSTISPTINRVAEPIKSIQILEEHDNRKIISLAPSYYQNRQIKPKQSQTKVYSDKNGFNTPKMFKNEEKVNGFDANEQSQLKRLKLELEKKERELKQCKNSLQISEKKNKSLEIQMKKLESNHKVISENKYPLVTYPSLSNYSHKRNGSEISKEAGGTAQAFLYLTLLMVFLAKDMTGI